jgi:hypothetical protein
MRAGLRVIHSLPTQYSNEADFCHSAATAVASSHAVLPVYFRLKFPAMVPEAKIWQLHRFQPFLRSSNSPERDSSGCPASFLPVPPIEIQGHTSLYAELPGIAR